MLIKDNNSYEMWMRMILSKVRYYQVLVTLLHLALFQIMFYATSRRASTTTFGVISRSHFHWNDEIKNVLNEGRIWANSFSSSKKLHKKYMHLAGKLCSEAIRSTLRFCDVYVASLRMCGYYLPCNKIEEDGCLRMYEFLNKQG